MQPGQSAHRQAHLADQAARQAQLQVRLGHQQAQQARQRRRQQAQHPAPFVPAEEPGSRSSVPSPQTAARARAGRITRWAIAVTVVSWAIAVVTHIEWVRLHDGPISPVSYSLSIAVSVLAVGVLLVLCALSTRKRGRSHE